MPDTSSEERLAIFRSPKFAETEFLLVALNGREALSQPYELHATLETNVNFDPDKLKDLLAEPVFIGWEGGTGRKVHAVVISADFVPHPEEPIFRILVTLVPRVWYLSQTRRSRIYLDKTVPEILKTVLDDSALKANADKEFYRLKLTGKYPKRPYVVQYHETDLQFVSRLMEWEGIFYYFAQTDDHEVMVIADANNAFDTQTVGQPMHFVPMRGIARPEPGLQQISKRMQVLPHAMHVRDYNPEFPQGGVLENSDVVMNADWSAERGLGSYVSDLEHADTVDDATRIAKIRAAEARVREVAYDGRTDQATLSPGMVFSIDGHNVAAFNQDYLVTEVTHQLDQELLFNRQRNLEVASEAPNDAREPYFNHFGAITKDVPYRPLRLTPKPRCWGVITARIDGEGNATTAPIDDQGRYAVVMPFDTVGGAPGSASCRIRMAQFSSGPGYGAHFPLHEGTDVLIAHIDGDPDRPVIVGALPNPQTAGPVVKSTATRSVIRTRSAIRVEFEDDA